MKLQKFNLLILASLAIIATIGCKKDEETETLPSLVGSPKFNIEEFVLSGTKVTLSAQEVEHPDDKTIGYYWRVSPDMEKSDTTMTEDGKGTRNFTYTFPDSLGTYTITSTAFASGHYSSSASMYATTVSPEILNGSITNADLNVLDTDFIVDSRDNEKYFITTIGEQQWFRQNLRYKGDDSENLIGEGFREAEVMTGVFGRYYNWNEAQVVCPSGWRLPSEADWAELGESLSGETVEQGEVIKGISGKMMVNAKFNTIKMWEFFPDVKITNSSKLSVIPVGYATIADGYSNFDGVYNYAMFWTSTSNPDNTKQAIYRYLYKEYTDLFIASGDKASFASPVRCVRNL